MATVFEMIINGDIPSTKLYEDESLLVILDINPVAKGHSLVISKTVYPNFTPHPRHPPLQGRRTELRLHEDEV